MPGANHEQRPGRLSLGYILLSLLSIAGLAVLIAFTDAIREGDPLGFAAPYRRYLVSAELVVLGILVTELVSRWLYHALLRRMTPDSAAAIRIVVRIVGYGVLLSLLVSQITDNAAAALTTGAFAGLVAGLATQTVIGNAVAGVFRAFFRPVRVGDTVTIAGNRGTISDVTLMHIISTAEADTLVPSSQVVSSVIVRHKPASRA